MADNSVEVNEGQSVSDGEESQEETSQEVDNQVDDSQETDDSSGEGETKYTEKGTGLVFCGENY